MVLVGLYVRAQSGWEYYAYGTITGYEAAANSHIADGFWNLKVTNNKIILDMYYMEINDIETVENSPEGSADIFHFSITGKPMMFIESADKLEIFAVMRVEKDWARERWYLH